VHAAFKAATEHKGAPPSFWPKPSRIGLGEAVRQEHYPPTEEAERRRTAEFRSRFGFPSLTGMHDAPSHRPRMIAEILYMQERRQRLGAICGAQVRSKPIAPVSESHFEEFHKGTDGREVSTTMVFVRCWENCCVIRKSVSSSCPSFLTKLAPSAWKLSSPVGFIQVGQLYSRWTWIRFLL